MKKIICVLGMCLLLFCSACGGGMSIPKFRAYSDRDVLLEINFSKQSYAPDEDITINYRIGINYLDERKAEWEYSFEAHLLAYTQNESGDLDEKERMTYVIEEVDPETPERYSFTVEDNMEERNSAKNWKYKYTLFYDNDPETAVIPRELFPANTPHRLSFVITGIKTPLSEPGEEEPEREVYSIEEKEVDYHYDEAGNLIINKI